MCWIRAEPPTSVLVLRMTVFASRRRVMPDEQLRKCEQHFRARAASSPRRRSIGVLIAAEVADVRLGYVASSDATLGWLLTHGPADEHWRLACAETRALAEQCPGAAR